MSVLDPWVIVRDALERQWRGPQTAKTVVGWAFDALDTEGDDTVPRTWFARQEAETLVGMVFADIGDEADAGTVASHILRAARGPGRPPAY